MEQSATEVAHDQRRVVLLQPRNGVVAGGAVAQGNLRLLATKKAPEAGLSLIAAFSETYVFSNFYSNFSLIFGKL